jgi:hypothetical protein
VDLFDRVSALVEQARESIAAHANATLTLTFWQVGRLIDTEVLASERADYGAEIVVTLSRQLAGRYGRSFEEKNLRRMVQFARSFPDAEILATLAQRLSWSHFLALLPLRDAQARVFYANKAVMERLTVRELRSAVARKSFERREIANSQLGPARWSRPTRSATPTSSTCSGCATTTWRQISRRQSCGIWRPSY